MLYKIIDFSVRPECFTKLLSAVKCIEGAILKTIIFLFIFYLTLRYILLRQGLRRTLRANGLKFKKIKRTESYFIVFVIFFIASLHAQNSQVISIISPRSQGFNIPRHVAGLDFVSHCPTENKLYSTYASTLEVQSSFRSERINQCFFGQDIIWRDKCDTEWKDFIIVSGSQTEKRTPQKDWLADYFGLPTDFRSMVRFRPRVNNVIFEMQSFFGFNNVIKGLYAELFLPIVYTNWDLNMREAVIDPGTNGYAPGYFNAQGVNRTDLLNGFMQYISGYSIPNINNLTFQPLRFGKMSPCSQRATHCAELRANLGYDFFIQDMHHVGIKMQVAAPLGNRPKALYLFEPIVGNQHHWELGVGFTSHALVWDNEPQEERVDFYINFLVNHMFKGHQRRSFDVKGKPNSRYMLVEKMTPNISNNLTGNGITPAGQFDREVTSLANLTTYDVNIKINVQADIALYCTYTHQNNYWTFGYNAWKRGCENISIKNKYNFPENTWAFKGNAQVYGFIGEQNNPNDLPIGTPVALSATQSNATINYGTNLPKNGVSTDLAQKNIQIKNALKNPGIDFPTPAFAGNNQRLVASPDDTAITNQINTSLPPVFVSALDIDCNSASTSGFSHKIFTHYNHIITTQGRAEINIGLGSEIEFGRQAGPPPAIGDDKCINCALSFWGMWLKGNVFW